MPVPSCSCSMNVDVKESRPTAPRHSTADGGERSQPKPSLRQLTTTPDDILAQYEPWATLSTRQLTAALGVDPGTVAVWRWREVGPPSRGARYAVSDVVQWLAERAGALLSEEDVLRRYLVANGMEEARSLDAEALRTVEALLRGATVYQR